MNNHIQKKLEAVEMWFLRRMLRIPWTARKSNEKVLLEANTNRRLINTVRKRQARFFGHVLRRENMEYDITTGKLNGTRGKGRPREMMIDGLKTWLKAEKVSDVLIAVKDRCAWKEMIANATKQGI